MWLSTPGRTRTLIALLALAMAFGASAAVAQKPAAVELAVVVHPDLPVDDVSFAELRKVLLGDRQPKIFYSNEMAFTLVAQIPGAVALVNADEAPAGVKVLKVDGRGPGDADYRLR